MAQQIGRSAAENDKAGWQGLLVEQNPQHRKQIGTALDFVDDDQPTQILKSYHWLIKACKAERILQIEIAFGFGRYELAGQACFPALARADQPNYTATLQSILYSLE